MERRETAYTVGGTVNWYSHYGEQYGFLKKTENRANILPFHPSPGHISRGKHDICFIDYTKAFDCMDHKKLLKILQEMGIPDHLTCLLRNLNSGQKATVLTGHVTTDWFQIGKGVYQSCILSPCLFNF